MTDSSGIGIRSASRRHLSLSGSSHITLISTFPVRPGNTRSVMTVLKETWDFHWLSCVYLRGTESSSAGAGMNIKCVHTWNANYGEIMWAERHLIVEVFALAGKRNQFLGEISVTRATDWGYKLSIVSRRCPSIFRSVTK